MVRVDVIVTMGKELQKLIVFWNVAKTYGGGYDDAPPFLFNPTQIVSPGKLVPELLGSIGM